MSKTVLRAVKPYDPAWHGPFCTRSGRRIKLLDRSPSSLYPIVGHPYGAPSIHMAWTEEGIFDVSCKTGAPLDLMCAEFSTDEEPSVSTPPAITGAEATRTAVPLRPYDPKWPGPFCTQGCLLVVDVTRNKDDADNPYPISGVIASSGARYVWTATGLPHATHSDASDPMNLMCAEYLCVTQDAPIAAATPDTERGLRYNADKLRYDLLPPDAMEALVRVFTFGAKKYAPRNWEKGMPWMECDASLRRHLAAWEMGERLDPESGEPHLAHAAWNALALLTFELRDIGEDDRPSIAPSNPRS